MFIYGPRVAVMPILRPYRLHDIRGNMTVTSPSFVHEVCLMNLDGLFCDFFSTELAPFSILASALATCLSRRPDR